MNKNRLIQWISLGILCVSVVVLAQNLPQVPPVTDARPNFGSVVSRPEGAMPKVPAGFTVELYADNVAGARLMEFASNGDLFVSQPAQNAIMVLRDTKKSGKPDERFTYAQGPAPAGRGGPGGARTDRAGARARAGTDARERGAGRRSDSELCGVMRSAV